MLTFWQEHNPQSSLYRLQPHMTAVTFTIQMLTTTTSMNFSCVQLAFCNHVIPRWDRSLKTEHLAIKTAGINSSH